MIHVLFPLQAKVQDLFGATNKRLVGATMAALADGDMQRVGSLMVEAQAAFDAVGAVNRTH